MIVALLALIFGLLAGGLGGWLFLLASRARDDGRREAELVQRQEAMASAQQAAVVAEQARQGHAKDKTDAAFDPDFWRD